MPREGDDEEDGGSKNDDGVRVGQREEGDGSLQEKQRTREERDKQTFTPGPWDENQFEIGHRGVRDLARLRRS